jgi:hypothetical protein
MILQEYKEDASFDTFSKAVICLATRRFSSAGCKQVPGRRKFVRRWKANIAKKIEIVRRKLTLQLFTS